MEKIDLKTEYFSKTGESSRNYQIGELRIHEKKDCAIIFKLFDSGLIWMYGSIHKFWKGNNHELFTLYEAQIAFDYLLNLVGVERMDCKLLKLEYGVNAMLPFSPELILERLICYKAKPFDRMSGINNIGFRRDLSEYCFKIYNKSKQYKLTNKNLLRVEKQVTDMHHLRKKGINTLSDLGLKKSIILMIEITNPFISEILYDDKRLDEKSLNMNQKRALAQYRNPNFWSGISKEKRRNSKNIFLNYHSLYGKEFYFKDLIYYMNETISLIFRDYETESQCI